MTIIPCSPTFDQQTLTLMLEHDPVVQRYRAFFALFEWRVVPEPPSIPLNRASELTHNVLTSRLSCSRWRKT